MSSFLVIRHAATDWNEAGLIQGRVDRPLSGKGLAEAARWRVPFGWCGARCFVSPLQRTVQTARLMGLQATPESRLIEMAWGDWEGRRLADLRVEDPSFASEEARGLDLHPPGGESPRDVQRRLRAFLADLQEPAILVTHKGVLRALLALAVGWDMREKAPCKLLAAHAHQFRIDAGETAVARLNISLDQPA
jgi:broad specificity phosphatase PhoE